MNIFSKPTTRDMITKQDVISRYGKDAVISGKNKLDKQAPREVIYRMMETLGNSYIYAFSVYETFQEIMDDAYDAYMSVFTSKNEEQIIGVSQRLVFEMWNDADADVARLSIRTKSPMYVSPTGTSGVQISAHSIDGGVAVPFDISSVKMMRSFLLDYKGTLYSLQKAARIAQKQNDPVVTVYLPTGV